VAAMRCYCCDAEVSLARKVKLRSWREFPDPEAGPDSPAYAFYRREMTFRWAVVCPACYRALDNACGRAEVGGKAFNLAGASRGDKAPVLDPAKYRAWQQHEAEKMGLRSAGS
jgi:hypothetical protein